MVKISHTWVKMLFVAGMILGCSGDESAEEAPAEEAAEESQQVVSIEQPDSPGSAPQQMLPAPIEPQPPKQKKEEAAEVFVSTESSADTVAPGKPELTLVSPEPRANLSELTLRATEISEDATLRIFASADCSGDPQQTLAATATQAMDAVVADLPEGEHDFSVDLVDAADNTSPCSDSVTYVRDTTAPAVTELSHLPFTTSASTSPLITWGTDSDDLLKYQVAIGDTPGAANVVEWTDTFTSSLQLEGLALDGCASTYYVSVIAFDTVGNFSTAVVSTGFQFDNTPPGIPQGIVASNDADEARGATTAWETSIDDCGLSHYEIAVSSTESIDEIVAGGDFRDVGDVLAGRFESGLSLEPFQEYFTLVRAVDAAGNQSAYAPSAEWFIPGPPYGVSNLTIGAKTINSLEIAWTEPNDNGNPITDYFIEMRFTGETDEDWVVYDDGESTELSTVVEALFDNTSYDFRVRAYNGTTGDYSNTATGETLLDIPFFEPELYKAINIGGAEQSAVVAFDNETVITIGEEEIELDAGETHEFDSETNAVIESSSPFFVAGRKGNSGVTANMKGNMVWGNKDWSGKDFLFTGTRDAPHIITVYAFENAEVTLSKGDVELEVHNIDIEVDATYSFSTSLNGAFRLTSDGLIVAFMHSNSGGRVTDPKPLLPIANDIVGYPSKSAKVSSSSNGNAVLIHHSDGEIDSNTVNAGSELNVTPNGSNTSLYNGESTRIVADEPIVANSNADSNGYCSAPYLPISLMRLRYAINVEANYVAFVSLEPGDITMIEPDGTETVIPLSQSGSNPEAPYRARVGVTPAGTRFVGDVKLAAWYQPQTDDYGSAEDETIMFGFD